MNSDEAHLYVGVGPYEKLSPQKNGHPTNEVRRRCEQCGGWARPVTRVLVRGDMLGKDLGQVLFAAAARTEGRYLPLRKGCAGRSIYAEPPRAPTRRPHLVLHAHVDPRHVHGVCLQEQYGLHRYEKGDEETYGVGRGSVSGNHRWNGCDG
jgi:hypothetical protein